MEVYGQPLDRSGLLAHVGQLSQVAGIRLVTLADGAGRGTRLLEFRSGAGLDHAMSPQTADATDPRFPAKLTNDYPLHGRLSGEPATLVGYGEIWSGDECTLWAEGVVRQVSAFGEVLQLRRRIDCRVGTNEFRVHDTVTNLDYSPSAHMLLYHVNLGFPLIAKGSPSWTTTPPPAVIAC